MKINKVNRFFITFIVILIGTIALVIYQENMLPTTGEKGNQEMVFSNPEQVPFIINGTKQAVPAKFPTTVISESKSKIVNAQVHVTYLDEGKGVFRIFYTKAKKADYFDSLTPKKDVFFSNEKIALVGNADDTPTTYATSDISDSQVVKLTDSKEMKTFTFSIKNVDLSGRLSSGGIQFHRWVPGYSMADDVKIYSASVTTEDVLSRSEVDFSKLKVQVQDENRYNEPAARELETFTAQQGSDGQVFEYDQKGKTGSYRFIISYDGTYKKEFSVTTVGQTSPTFNPYLGVSTMANSSLEGLKTGPFGSVRIEVPWYSVETEKQQYKIPAQILSQMDFAKENNLRMLLVLSGKSPLYNDNHLPITEDSQVAWSNFAGWVAEFTKNNGYLADFEIYNEWRIAACAEKLGNQPDTYSSLVKKAYSKIKAIDASAKVIIGAIDGVSNPGYPNWINKVINTCYDYLDGFSIHTYPKHGGTHGAAEGIKKIVEGTLKDSVSPVIKPRPFNKEIWITEYGFATNPTDLVNPYPTLTTIQESTNVLDQFNTDKAKLLAKEREAANSMMDFYLRLRAIPQVKKLFLYNNKNNSVNYKDSEQNYGMFRNEKDPMGELSPKLFYQTIYQCASLLGHPSYNTQVLKSDTTSVDILFENQSQVFQASMTTATDPLIENVISEKVNLQPASSSFYSLKQDKYTYNGKGQEAVINLVNKDTGEIETVYYKLKGSKTWTTTLPKEVGNYEVAIVTKVSKRYQAGKQLVLGQIQIKKSSAKASDYTMNSSVTYNGKAQKVNVKKKVTSGGSVKKVYYLKNGTKNWTGTAPKSIGSYKVSIDVSETKHIESKSKLIIGNFSIKKKQVTKSLFSYRKSVKYNKKAQSANVKKKKVSGLGSKLLVYYDLVGKKDKMTQKKPTRKGNYNITVNLSEGQIYYKTKNLYIGKFKIR